MNGISSLYSQHEQVNQATANLFASVGISSSNKARSESHTNIFDSNLTFASKTYDSEVEALQIPARLNTHENELHWSPCLREQWGNEDFQKLRSHASFGTSAATKVALGLFSLVALATSIKIPEHQTNPKYTFTEQVINRFHKENKFYDVTLNEVNHLFYATNISSNKSFTIRNVMKQDDKLAFVDTM